MQLSPFGNLSIHLLNSNVSTWLISLFSMFLLFLLHFLSFPFSPSVLCLCFTHTIGLSPSHFSPWNWSLADWLSWLHLFPRLAFVCASCFFFFFLLILFTPPSFTLSLAPHPLSPSSHSFSPPNLSHFIYLLYTPCRPPFLHNSIYPLSC